MEQVNTTNQLLALLVKELIESNKFNRFKEGFNHDREDSAVKMLNKVVSDGGINVYM